MEIALSQDQISKYADKILLYTNTCMKELRRLFLVQDLVDSLKVLLDIPTPDYWNRFPSRHQSRNVFEILLAFQFAVLMWLLTYVGALFNGLTLLILGELTGGKYGLKRSHTGRCRHTASVYILTSQL